MEETFLDSVSRWLGYIALTWITYLIYVASGVSIADCVAAVLKPKKTETPKIQVIPATPSTPDKTFENFELPPVPEGTNIKPDRDEESDVDPVPADAPAKSIENTDHPTDSVTSECTESVAAPETSAIAAAASATSAVLSNAAPRITSATELGDPMCDATTRFNVTRCSFSVEKLQMLPSIKILTPEDVCPPGTLISGLPESGNNDSSDSDSSPTTTNTSRASDEQSTNLTDDHSPQRSNPDNGTTPAGRRTGGDDLLVRMLCDIDQVDAYLDLKKPRPSIDELLLASDAASLLVADKQRDGQNHLQQQKQRKQHDKQVSWDVPPEKAVRFALPEPNTADGSDSCSEDEDERSHESPDSDDEDSEGSPKTQRKTPSRVTPSATEVHAASPMYDRPLKDLSDEALDESTANIDTDSVLDALLFQNRRRRSLPSVQSPGGDYEMVYREKLERQSLGDNSILTETSVTPQKFKAWLREEDFTDLLPPLSPDCGYDSLSEMLSSPDDFDCYGSAQQLSVIVEDPFEDDKNTVQKKNAPVQNGSADSDASAEAALGSTMNVKHEPVEAALISTMNVKHEPVEATLISTMNVKHEPVDGMTASPPNRNHFRPPTEDFDNFTTVRL